MSYAIFRAEPINKLKDLGQIGAHNERLKEAYQSNPDINKSKSIDNIALVDCDDNFLKAYMKLVEPYKKQHQEKQKTIREDRKKSFSQMLDNSNSVIADEMLFTSDNEFFKDMSKDEIIRWANTCMDFIYEDIGYSKNQILNATIHLDEKTPHLHVVLVPLIKKYDKRSKQEKWTISKKHYMKNKEYLSLLQDKYWERLNKNGFNLERGIKNTDNKHIKIKEYKRLTKKLNLEIQNENNKLDKAISDFEEKMTTTKEMLFDKEHIKIKKDTFDSMSKVIKESKKMLEIQPKIQTLYDEVDNYTTTYQNLQKENINIKKEVEKLKVKNKELKQENKELENQNNNLLHYIREMLKALKKVFRKVLSLGKSEEQYIVIDEVKNYYDNKFYNENDIFDIAVNTKSEDELFKYADIDKDYQKEKDIDMEM